MTDLNAHITTVTTPQVSYPGECAENNTPIPSIFTEMVSFFKYVNVSNVKDDIVALYWTKMSENSEMLLGQQHRV